LIHAGQPFEAESVTDSLPAAHRSIDKLDAARRQIECAIRLVAAEEDELAIHLPPTRPIATTREGWRIWPEQASSSPCM
jgi:hypothetical protein